MMKYEQPTIVVLAPALDAIQSSTTKGKNASDNSGDHATTNAYEADE